MKKITAEEARAAHIPTYFSQEVAYVRRAFEYGATLVHIYDASTDEKWVIGSIKELDAWIRTPPELRRVAAIVREVL